MKTSFSGIVIDGGVQLDERVDLADDCRVQVTVIPIDDWKRRWTQSLAALDQLRKENPIRSGGMRFTREQLHERS
jgi:hypothetical protein